MPSIDEVFERRLSRIPSLGLGLSVDVYTPDLFELLAALDDRDVSYGYLEIFKGSRVAMSEVRRRLPERSLAYHGEGVWLTQPDWDERYPAQQEVMAAAEQLALLGSCWMNHECATKQMAGYSFGTYLPPLFTPESADVVAMQASQLQQRLAESGFFTSGEEPLLLLEVPPLTYFGLGSMSVPAFFARIVKRASCGLVLDVGHVWTIWRYTNAWRTQSITTFLADFLERFPLHRVVQIHVAGLDVHESTVAENGGRSGCPPLWIDSHGAPIPPVLFEMLRQILAHPRLTALRGVALEVDTKAIPTIVSEFERTAEEFGAMIDAVCTLRNTQPRTETSAVVEPDSADISLARRRALLADYARYAELVTGHGGAIPDGLALLDSQSGGLAMYRQSYLPYEILKWGGDVLELFCPVWQRLDEAGIGSADFIDFWNTARPAHSPYDFFLLKLDRFCEFVSHALPSAAPLARIEADVLRSAYGEACNGLGDPVQSRA